MAIIEDFMKWTERHKVLSLFIALGCTIAFTFLVQQVFLISHKLSLADAKISAKGNAGNITEILDVDHTGILKRYIDSCLYNCEQKVKFQSYYENFTFLDYKNCTDTCVSDVEKELEKR